MFPWRQIAIVTTVFLSPCLQWHDSSAGSVSGADLTELMQQAMQHYQEGNLRDAITTTKKALSLQKQMLPEASDDVADTLSMLGQMQTQVGQVKEAEDSFTEAFDLLKVSLGEDHWRTKDAQLAISELEFWHGMSDAQRAELERTRDLHSRTMELYEAGRFEEAIQAGHEVLEAEQRLFGRQHQQVAESLNGLGRMYHQQAQYSEAEQLYSEAAEVRRKIFGEQHPQFADSLSNRAGLLLDSGSAQKAVPLFTKALAIYQQAYGEASAEYIDTLDSLAGAYGVLADYDEAESRYLKALELAEDHLGPLHPLYNRLQNNIGVHYSEIGDDSRAEEFCQRSLNLLRTTVGEEHPDYATALSNLGKLQQNMGDYQGACELYEQSIEISRNVLGDAHPVVLTTQDNLTQTLALQGRFTQAEALYREVLSKRAEVLGTEHPDYAATLDGLARVLEKTGDYVQAMQCYREAAEIQKKRFGTDHRDYAQSLSSLARGHTSMGDFSIAEQLYSESIRIIEHSLGEDHADVGTACANLADWHLSIGEYEKARPLYDKSLRIYEKAIGSQHPFNANSLKGLAMLHLERLAPNEARPFIEQALRIEERSLGEQHPDYSESLLLLALVEMRLGHAQAAEALIGKAISLSEAALGPSHPNLPGLHMNLAIIRFSQGNTSEALTLFQRALEASHDLLEMTARAQSERQQLAMEDSVRGLLDVFLSAALLDPSYQETAYREVLRWKGATLVRQREIRKVGQHPDLAPLFRKLQRVSARLATLARIVPDPERQETWRRQIAELSAETEELEVQLSARSRAFREAAKDVEVVEIQRSLPAGTVLVDYVEYFHGDLYDVSQPPERSLLAFVVSSNDDLRMVSLGDSASIGEEIDRWRKTYGMSREGVMAGHELRRRLWEPVEQFIGDASHVLVSVDGVLGRYPIAALPGREPGTYLLEDHRVALLPVPHLLPELVREMDRKKLKRGLLLMGDVEYDEASDEQATVAQLSRPSRGMNHARRSTTFSFSALPGTATEIRSIAELYSDAVSNDPDALHILEKQQATEDAFRSLSGTVSTLHLATHGFFAAPGETTQTSLSTLPGHITRSFAGRRPNPGLLSGLAFSGANRVPVADSDDGILTADEISSLSLDNVQLVVLSACETGLGEIAGGEGLLGIQRAFQVAGADTTIASLWQVGDVATMLLMERFYRNHWERNMNQLEAFREAQLYLLNHPEDVMNNKSFRGDRRVRATQYQKQSKRLSPEFWAAFSLSGMGF